MDTQVPEMHLLTSVFHQGNSPGGKENQSERIRRGPETVERGSGCRLYFLPKVIHPPRHGRRVEKVVPRFIVNFQIGDKDIPDFGRVVIL